MPTTIKYFQVSKIKKYWWENQGEVNADCRKWKTDTNEDED